MDGCYFKPQAPAVVGGQWCLAGWAVGSGGGGLVVVGGGKGAARSHRRGPRRAPKYTPESLGYSQEVPGVYSTPGKVEIGKKGRRKKTSNRFTT